MSPEEYPALSISKEEEYRQCFLFWKSWHDEFINAIQYEKSHKKQLNCLEEAIKNITQAKTLLAEQKQKELDVHIQELNVMREMLEKDVYVASANRYTNKAETIKKNILRYFSYPKIKDYLK